MTDFRYVRRLLTPQTLLKVNARKERMCLYFLCASVTTDAILCVTAEAADEVRCVLVQSSLRRNAKCASPVDNLVKKKVIPAD